MNKGNIPIKRGRGRPPKFKAELVDAAGGGCLRTANNRIYRARAEKIIEAYRAHDPEKAERLAWLLPPNRREAVLTEIGRAADPNRMIVVALAVATQQASSVEGVRLARRVRLALDA